MTTKKPFIPRIGAIWPGQGIYAGIVRGEPGLPDYHLFGGTACASRIRNTLAPA